ncbi:LysR substrate-binding domain-containing protein [Robbsia andropogonis]|uniref:LysR substrate-binding domain-containing protein n=1 Tax=Robbsia andropogonis TaxID=28092 RepID=UPI00209F050B|nr:LysR substrate-binding domain-containing protein [Robbsia andropogonis]MCP1120009.1 LysR substrate-binding domain-containing protein [Robbsia andropogonis]MCP1129932.1 LysR substrate-binding domain-containing protein [Robbsia andropogonis]
MGIREIEVFRAVMTSGSTSKAAGLLNISQPAVSQSIRKLEESAKLRLFERVRGRLLPTQEALALMNDVDRYFVGFEVIEHRIRSLGTYGLGRLAIASLPALGTGFIPRVISHFGAEARQVQISLQIMSSREVHERVSAGQADFGLMSDEMSFSGLEHSPFINMPGVAVMNAQHPLAKSPGVRTSDLNGLSFIALNPEDSMRRRLEARLDEMHIKMRPVVETPYSHTVCELALAGVGVGIAHPIVAIDYLARGLAIKPIEVETVFTSVLVFRAGSPLSENAKQFLRSMRVQLSRDEKVVEKALKVGASRVGGGV